jgi:diguanylate cyclase (GGDEF)-like protein/PAS domain S-box-containing protein
MLTILVVTLVMALGLGMAVRHYAEIDMQAQVELTLESVAASARSRLDLAVADLHAQLRAAARAEAAADSAAQVPRLENFLSAHPSLTWIAYADDQGDILTAAGEAPGTKIDRESWFSQALRAANGARPSGTMESIPGQADEGARTAPIPFAIATAVRNGDGRTKGVLVAVVAPDHLSGVLRGARETHFRARGIELMIADARGGVLARTDGSTRSHQGQPGLIAAMQGQDKVAWEDDGKSRSLVAYSGLRNNDPGNVGWSVIACQDAEAAQAPLANLASNIAAAAIVAILLALAAASIVVERFMRPVQMLTTTAERIRQGDLHPAFPAIGGIREIRQLSAALHEMTDSLVNKEQALTAANTALEQRVRERTLALVKAGRTLERERERLAQSLEASRIVSWEADVATGVVWLSAEWGRMVGAEPQETAATLRQLLSRVPRNERKRTTAILSRVISGELSRFDVEIGVVRDDGSRFWLRTRGQITMRDEGGRALRLSGTHSDITRRRLAEDELRQSEAKLRLVTDNIPVMINFLDREGRYFFVNKPYLDFLGLPDQNLVGKRLRDVAGEEAETIALSHLPELEAGTLVTYERIRKDSQGRTRHFEVRQVPHLDTDHRLLGFYSLIEDVTERDEAKRALAASEAQLRHLADNLPTIICEVDMSGKILYANRGYHEFYGLRSGGATGKRIVDVAGLEAQLEFDRCVGELREGVKLMYEREVSIRDKPAVQLEVHLVPRVSFDGSVHSTYAMIIDVTARKKMEELLQQQALTDELTGLPNRRLLEDRIDNAIARSSRGGGGFGLLYIDLDGFKPVNDSLGHAAGDGVLKQAAARFAAVVREGDTVARVGGDEFVILLSACPSPADAAAAAIKVINVLRDPFLLAMGEARVLCSVGIAMYPMDGTNAETLLHMADVGLYAAKRAGKGRHMHVSAAVPAG